MISNESQPTTMLTHLADDNSDIDSTITSNLTNDIVENLDTEPTQLNRLLKVSLINSYLKGKLHTLDLDNNCLITGNNAAGKTSLMHAIVPFYGTPLSAVSRKNEVLKGFAEHYLPFDNSYIVYEYIRAGEHCHVVLRSQASKTSVDNQNRTTYFNFISGQFDEKAFVGVREDNTTYFNNFNDIRVRLESEGHYVSSNLSQSEFAAIISNAPISRLRTTTNNNRQSMKTISRLSQRFSLTSDSKATFYGFSGIASNVLQSKLHFDDIAKFLVDALKSNRSLDNQGLVFNTANSNVNTALWVRQRRTWQEIESLKPTFAQLDNTLKSNIIHQTELAYQEHHAKAVVDKIQTDIRASSTDKSAQIKSLEEATASQQTTKNQWHEVSGILEADIKLNTRAIAQLQQQYADFEQGTSDGMRHLPMHKLKDLAAKLPSLHQQKQGQVESYDFHSKQLKQAKFNLDAINAQHDADIKRFESERDTKIHLIEKSIGLTKLEFSQKHQDLEREFNASVQTVKDNYQQDRDALAITINNLEVEIATLREKVSNNQYSDNHQKAMDDNAGKLEQARVKQDSIQAKLRDDTKAVDLIKADIEISLDLQRKRKGAVQANLSEIANYRSLIQGDSLYSFLLNSEPEFGDDQAITNIRKVFGESLLAREDLSPAWLPTDTDAQTTAFGLSIDTDKIKQKPRHTKQDILKTISQLDNANHALTAEIESADTALNKLTKRHEAAKSNVAQTQLELTKIASDIKGFTDNSSYLLIKAQEERQTRTDALNAKINAYQVDIDGKNHQVKQAKNTLEAELASLKDGFDKTISQQKIIKTDRIIALEADIDATESEYQSKVVEAGRIKDKAIQDEGYDPSILKSIETEITNINKQIQLAEKAQHRIELFNNFLETDYPSLATLKQDKATLDQQLHNAQQQYNADSNAHASQIKALTAKIGALTKHIDALKTDNDRLGVHIAKISEHLNRATLAALTVDTSATDIEGSDTRLLTENTLRSIQAAIDSAKSTTAEGLKLINKIKVPFNSNEQMFEDLFVEYNYTGITTARDWYMQAQLFMDYLATDHENKKDLIIGNYTMEAEKINNFKHDLDAANKNLKKFASAINKNCAEICDNLNSLAIEHFQLKVESKIEENQWYKTLDNFSTAYSQWEGSERHTNPLPSDNLIAHLDKVQQEIGQNNLNVDFADQFSIELEIKQYGEPARRATRSSSVKDLSSNGTIRIAQLIIYLALTKVVTSAPCTELKLFIDEVGVIDPNNTKELLALLEAQQVSAMCAAPEAVNDGVIPHFTNNIACSHSKKGVYRLAQTTDLSYLTQEHKLKMNGAFTVPNIV